MYEVVIINNNEIQIHIVQSFYGLTTLIATKPFLTFSNTENMLYNISKSLGIHYGKNPFSDIFVVFWD